jgi:hypothetical protein
MTKDSPHVPGGLPQGRRRKVPLSPPNRFCNHCHHAEGHHPHGRCLVRGCACILWAPPPIPLCTVPGCNHSISLHGGFFAGRCLSKGCRCGDWAGPGPARCSLCGHRESFHGGGANPCMATGCVCAVMVADIDGTCGSRARRAPGQHAPQPASNDSSEDAGAPAAEPVEPVVVEPKQVGVVVSVVLPMPMMVTFEIVRGWEV